MKTTGYLFLFLLLGLSCVYNCTPNYYTEAPDVTLSTVLTTPASNITSSEATLGVDVICNGNSPITERGIVYATNQNPSISDTKVAFKGGGGTGNWAVTITGLNPATTYYARAFAINSRGIAYGPQETFSCCPPHSIPSVITLPPEYLNNTSIYLAGKVTQQGSTYVTERGFVYAETKNPTSSDTKIEVAIDFEYGFGFDEIFSQPVQGLTTGKTYYVRAYAVNGVDIAYGNEEIFICK